MTNYGAFVELEPGIEEAISPLLCVSFSSFRSCSVPSGASAAAAVL